MECSPAILSFVTIVPRPGGPAQARGRDSGARSGPSGMDRIASPAVARDVVSKTVPRSARGKGDTDEDHRSSAGARQARAQARPARRHLGPPDGRRADASSRPGTGSSPTAFSADHRLPRCPAARLADRPTDPSRLVQGSHALIGTGKARHRQQSGDPRLGYLARAFSTRATTSRGAACSSAIASPRRSRASRPRRTCSARERGSVRHSHRADPRRGDGVLAEVARQRTRPRRLLRRRRRERLPHPRRQPVATATRSPGSPRTGC